MAEEASNQNALSQGSNFVWHEIYAPTAQAAIDFYTATLDFGSTEMDMGGGNSYKMLTRNGVPICGVFGTTEHPGMENVPPHWTTYLAVDDVDAKIALCTQHGAKVIHGPMDVPTIGRMVLIQDPVGAMIWLFKGAM